MKTRSAADGDSGSIRVEEGEEEDEEKGDEAVSCGAGGDAKAAAASSGLNHPVPGGADTCLWRRAIRAFRQLLVRGKPTLLISCYNPCFA